MKRFLTFLLALLMCMGLVSCTLPEPADVNAGGQDSNAISSDLRTDPPETLPPAIPVEVISGGTTEYTIIRPDSNVAEITDAAVSLRTRLIEATGAQIKIATDWYKKGDVLPETAREIVVGKCDRPATAKIAAELRERDFAIVYEGERIYIIGGGAEATARGVDYFFENYVDKENKSVVVKTDLNYISRYEYALGLFKVGGVSINEYRIVIPANTASESWAYVNAAAANLADYLYYNAGITLDIVTDKEPEAEYEILVGKTNRAESGAASAVTLGADQYVLAATSSKIVMTGKSYMVGGAVSDFINNYAVSHGKNVEFDITTLPSTYSAKTFTFKPAKNAILLIGDGMGHNHVEATKAAGLPEFVAQQLPNIGKAITYSQSVKLGKSGYTDSAAAATALATGYKTINGYIGLNQNQTKVTNVRELAQSKGAKTAVLTTDVITGATPGGFLAHVNDRNATAAIQKQIDSLIKENKVDFAVGSIGDGLVREAAHELWTISEGGSTFFQMIEAALIDKRSHSNDLASVISTTKRYNDVIAYCVQFTICHPDTVIIITADHETGGITYDSAKNTYYFTSTNHTNADVPVYAIGAGTEYFNNNRVENTEIAKFIARIYGESNFGG